MIVVITCSGHKASEPMPAIDLYRGNHYSMARDIARLLTDDDNIYIMSALHGLLPAKQVVAPYEQPMDETSPVTKERIVQQAKRLRINNFPVIFIGGDNYLRLIEGVFPVVHDIMPPGGTFYKQKDFMFKLRERLTKNVTH